MGVGVGYATTAAPILLSELAYPSHRAPLSTSYLGLVYVGAFIAAWITYGTSHLSDTSNWAWRIPSAGQAITPMIQLVVSWWIPESPRWLVAKGRAAEAQHILAYYHADGDEQSPLIQWEMDEIRQGVEMERQGRISLWRKFYRMIGEWRYLKRVLIIVMLVLFCQLSGVTLAAFYLNVILFQVGVTNPRTQVSPQPSYSGIPQHLQSC